MESVDIRFLSYKTARLLTLTSAKRVGDLHALSVRASCAQFTSVGEKATLCLNSTYLPQVIPETYRSRTYESSSFCPPPFFCICGEKEAAMSMPYIDRTQSLRLRDQPLGLHRTHLYSVFPVGALMHYARGFDQGLSVEYMSHCILYGLYEWATRYRNEVRHLVAPLRSWVW